MLPELAVSVDPSTYVTYPRIKYYSKVTIETAPGLPPGDYFYHISPSLEAGFGDAYAYIIYDSLSVLTGQPVGADFTVSVK